MGRILVHEPQAWKPGLEAPARLSISANIAAREPLIGQGCAAMVRAADAVLRPARLFPGEVLGRSQVVRQRILIPPSPGSNPGAPANLVQSLAISPTMSLRSSPLAAFLR